MMRIAALTSGRTDPSARFRVRQHIEPLHRMGVDVIEYIPRVDKHAGIPSAVERILPVKTLPAATAAWDIAKLAARVPGLVGSFSADLVWLNRELLPGRFTLERLLQRPYVLDVDDAVWRARPHGIATMTRLGRNASIVLAGNRYLANWFSTHTGNISIVPTAIDTERFHPASMPRATDARFTIGWTGTRGNFAYLYKLEEPLAAFLKQANAQLLIVAEEAPQFARIDPRDVQFREWTPEIECAALREMDVGLMPLPDNEWTRGKCSFKMLQYMATALPVVVSPVGMNAELLGLAQIGFGANSDAEWLSALQAVRANPTLATNMGNEGRRLVVKTFSRDVVSGQLAAIFGRLLTR
jgi:glycosyltransferase involved in cell wall biosynthesis